MAGARYQTVSVAHLYHHGTKVGGVVELLHCLVERYALSLAQLVESVCVLVMLLCRFGVDDGCALYVNRRGVAKDNEVCQVFGHDLLGCLDGAGVFALGQYDGLLIRLGCRLHGV